MATKKLAFIEPTTHRPGEAGEGVFGGRRHREEKMELQMYHLPSGNWVPPKPEGQSPQEVLAGAGRRGGPRHRP